MKNLAALITSGTVALAALVMAASPAAALTVPTLVPAPAPAPTTATPTAGLGDVVLLTQIAPAVTVGSSSWLALTWLGVRNVENFQVTAPTSTDGVSVAYPSNTATYASLSNGSTLSPAELDYTAVRLTLPASLPAGNKGLKIHATYTVNGAPKYFDDVITLPAVNYVGSSDFTQVTQSVSVPKDSTQWVDINFLGVAPSVNNFRVTATGPAGVTISYPADGTSTGLNSGTALGAKVNDNVAFKVTTSGLPAGTYTLNLTESYVTSGAKTANSTVKLVVA